MERARDKCNSHDDIWLSFCRLERLDAGVDQLHEVIEDGLAKSEVSFSHP